MGSNKTHKKQRGLDASGQDPLFEQEDEDTPWLDDEDFPDDEEDQQHRVKKSGKRFHRKWTQKDVIEED